MSRIDEIDTIEGNVGTERTAADRDRRIARHRDRPRLCWRARRSAGRGDLDRRGQDRGRARPFRRGCRGLGQAVAQAENARHRAARFGGGRDRLSARRAPRDARELAPGPRRQPADRPPAHQCRARDPARNRGDRQVVLGDRRPLSRGPHRRYQGGRDPADPQSAQETLHRLFVADRRRHHPGGRDHARRHGADGSAPDRRFRGRVRRSGRPYRDPGARPGAARRARGPGSAGMGAGRCAGAGRRDRGRRHHRPEPRRPSGNTAPGARY